MQTGDIKSFKRAVIIFLIAFAGVQLVDFGSYYLGYYGFSLPNKSDDLWWTFYQAAETSVCAAFGVAAADYLEAKRKKDPSKSNA
jgi:hypothetical protein